MNRCFASSTLFVLLVCAVCACSQPKPAPSDEPPTEPVERAPVERNREADSKPAPSGNAVETASTDLVTEFVEAFNAGELDGLSERFGDRVDARVFTRSSQLTPLSVIAPEDAEAFIEGYIAGIERENLKSLYKSGWTDAVAGAEKHGVGLVIVRSKGLEAYLGRRLYVPALVFGVCSKEGAEEIVFGTVFAELMEEMDMQDGSMDKVVGEGIGVRPQAPDDSQMPGDSQTIE